MALSGLRVVCGWRLPSRAFVRPVSTPSLPAHVTPPVLAPQVSPALCLHHPAWISRGLATTTEPITPATTDANAADNAEQAEIQVPSAVAALLDTPAMSKELLADMCKSLEDKGYWVHDNLLGKEVTGALRSEAETMFASGSMDRSYSTQVDGNENEVITYKKNVWSTELNGDEWQTALAHLLYTRNMVPTVAEAINEHMPDLSLSDKHYGTKLAVSAGDGSFYPKHVDTIGSPDTRKVTLVYYFNPNWVPEHGGELRLFTGPPDPEVMRRQVEWAKRRAEEKAKDQNSAVDDEADFDPCMLEVGTCNVEVVAPVDDRLVVFWSDLIPHDVTPVHSTSSEDHRWSLTLWLISKRTSQIAPRRHPLYKVIKAHFPESYK